MNFSYLVFISFVPYIFQFVAFAAPKELLLRKQGTHSYRSFSLSFIRRISNMGFNDDHVNRELFIKVPAIQ